MKDSPIALVTGAASGIGRHFAEALAALGYRLILVDLNEAALEDARQAILANSSSPPTEERVRVVVVDVASQAAVEQMVRELEARVSGLDLLVNCAGILGAGAFHEQPLTTFSRVIQVNLMGTVHVTHACLPWLQCAGGHVVNMASSASLHGWPMLAAYSAAKGAVENYSEAVRPELKRLGVGLTTVFPLLVDTPMLQKQKTAPILRGRRVTAEEVVRASLAGVKHRAARVFVPFTARLVALLHGIAPPVLDWWGARAGLPRHPKSAVSP
ncbi:MAG: SDR family oxidoreductase [Myxococcota bacterium]